MKKMIAFGVAASMAAGLAIAQVDNSMVMVDQGQQQAAQSTAEIALVSAYVWRGQVYNGDAVVQPQFTTAFNNFSFNVWANYDIKENVAGNEGDLSEIDLTLAYTLPLDINDVSFDVGAISYQFPANGDSASESNFELFGRATLLTLKDMVVPVIPSVTLFGDVKEVDGTYLLFDVAVPYELSDYLSVEGGVSAGWGNTSYNDFYWNDGDPRGKDAGWNDFNFYASASYELAENLTASVRLGYTMLAGGQIEDAGRAIYEDKEKAWGGVNIAYDF